MLEKCKNTMTYSYIEYKSPLSQHCWGRGFSCYWISVSILFNVMYLTSKSHHLSAISFVYTDV